MSSLERGTIVAQRYRLERELARGGMGCVWVARHLQLDVDVAIKFMTPQFAASPDARARFEREAKASASLKMVNTVQVSDYGVEDGAPFLVMELLDGEDLEARLGREGRLSLQATLSILDQVCRALRRAHEMGLVHRDLKPGNIFLARQGNEVVVKVLDFGIAKDTQAAFGGAATRTGALLGSPHYMSPEQVRSSNKVDHRSDLWALGVIAFRCLTGQLLFAGEEIGEVLVDVCTKPIPRVSAIAPELGSGVDAFFERALTRDPAGRFQSADELIGALTDAQEPATAAVRVAPAMLPRVAPSGPVPMGEAPNPPAQPVSIGDAPNPPAQLPATAPALVSPSGGTLSPSAQTHNEAERRSSSRRSTTIALVSLGGVSLALALAAVFLLSGRGVARPEPPSVPSAAPTASATAAPVPPSAGEPRLELVPSAVAPSVSASSAPSARPPVKSGPVHRTPGKSDDLLNHI